MATQPDSPAVTEQGFSELAGSRSGDNNNDQQGPADAIIFEEGDKDILIKWPNSPDASSYKIYIQNGQKESNEQSSEAEFSIKKKEYGLENGETFSMQVTATRQNGTVIQCYNRNYTVVSKSLSVPKNVQCYLDPDNPSRRIIGKWEPPDGETVKCYECSLYSRLSPTKKKLDDQKVQTAMAVFSFLKSEKTHYIGVRAVYMNNKTSDSAVSKAVKTEPVMRQDVDIKSIGKPQVTACREKCIGENLVSDFAWELPNLEQESNNFVLVKVKAELKKILWMALTVAENSRTTEPIDLDWGKKYSFRVTCQYRDLDTRKTTDVETTQEFETPIQQLKDLNITWKKEEITMQWSPAKGATSYKVKVLEKDQDKAVLDVKVGNQTKNKFDMTKSCRYGKTCKFVVEAEGKIAQTREMSKEVLIGDPFVATIVKLQKDQNNPARKLNASWQSPQSQPKQYLLKLCEVQIDGPARFKKEQVATFYTKDTHFSFAELKSQRTYLVQVVPLYKSGKADHDDFASYSNFEVTAERVVFQEEKSDRFGLPDKIFPTIGKNEPKNVIMELEWSPAIITSNYKHLGYDVVVEKKGYWLNPTTWIQNKVFERECEPEVTNINIDKLEQGNTYEIKLTTKLQDLDTLTVHPVTRTHKFHTNPATTKIHDCTWKEGVITFLWDPVTGANTYTLIVREPLTEEVLHRSINAAKECGSTGKCIKKVQMKENLGIGKTCSVKVLVVAEGNLRSETDWKTQLIGGKDVPRNVRAYQCKEDPVRSIAVAFDQPQEGLPDDFKVTAIPMTGRSKTRIFKNNTIKFEHLRKGVEYTFSVQAFYGQVASQPSVSNKFSTILGGASDAALNISGMSGSLDLSQATFAQSSTSINLPAGEGFGKVRDLRPEVKPNDGNDILKLHWKTPAFDYNSNDYHVHSYLVEVLRKGTDKGHKGSVVNKGEYTYETLDYSLELGQIYEVSVTTFYEDIDRDTDHTSSAARTTVYTRPCKPVMRPFKIKEDNITIEWNSANGAIGYQLEIFDDNSRASMFKVETKDDTTWKREFSEIFGYGTCFYAVITAKGRDDKTNSYQSPAETIGGDFVPRNVKASIQNKMVVDPNTQVFLSWEKPKSRPLSYDVASLPPTDNLTTTFEPNETTCCLVSGLKAGTYYYFKVFGIHKDPKTQKTFTSGGCQSQEKVQTNPTPTQVKNLKAVACAKQPSTMLSIKWDQVDAIKEQEQTQYRVTVTSIDQMQKFEIFVETEKLEVGGLSPGHTYYVTVAGGNSEGYGRDSDKTEVTTAFGSPTYVTLVPVETSPSSSLKLTYQGAQGEPTEYHVSLSNDMGEEDCHVDKVMNGHVFKDLKPNTKYGATMHAKYGENKGPFVKSPMTITAPDKAVIAESKCCVDDGINSADTFQLKWKAVPGCNIHEVAIGCADEEECVILIEDIHEYIHFCKHPMTQYSAKVRSKNSSGFFGDWSDKALIDLAPSGVKELKANLDIRTGDIKVECQKLSRAPTRYCMQAKCEGSEVGKVMPKTATECQDGVEFLFTPPENAKEYVFSVWAEGAENYKGKAASSNSVTSMPSRGNIVDVVRCDSNPSTDIQITWELQDRCDEYEIAIQQRGKDEPEHVGRFGEKATLCTYRCLSPGDQYSVSMRCFSKKIGGKPSERKKIELAPAEINLTEDEQENDEPRHRINIKWEEPRINPSGYITILYCGTVEIDRYEGKQREHTFDKTLKPGSQCYCTVAAFKILGDENERIAGNPVKTKMYKIRWTKPRHVHIKLLDDDPTKRARIKWDNPYGVNCFKLKIENNQNGVITTIKTEKHEHIFESGIPGNTYTVRLYCGCDSRYDLDFKEESMTMKPLPPRKIEVKANILAKGLEVHFQDASPHNRQYEVKCTPLTKGAEGEAEITSDTKHIFRDLLPGESYWVSVKSVMDDISSKEACYGSYVQTFPDQIKNLRSEAELKDGSIIYKWDELPFTPNAYRVQWRCNDEAFTEEETQNPTFEKQHPNPGCFYSIRVYAVNNAGSGKISDWVTFITNPSPPTNVEGHANPKCPESSIVISFEDTYDVLKSYRVTAKASTGEEVEPIETKQQYAVFDNLVPGEDYAVEVVTIFSGKESAPAFPRDV